MKRPRGISPLQPVAGRLRVLFFMAAAVAALGFAATTVVLAAAPQNFTAFEKDRARMMLKIVGDDLEKYYYDPTFHGLQLDEAFKAAGERIEQAASTGQALASVARPLLQLNDSHTFFIPPARAAHIQLGFRMQVVGDRCYVTAVQEGTDAEAKGLKRGDQVLSIDGHKVTRGNLWGVNYVYRVRRRGRR